MKYHRFSTYLLIRVIGLLVTLILMSVIFGDERLLFVQIILGTIILGQIYELIRFTNWTNKELSRFLMAIKNGDFSAKFSSNPLKGTFEDLNSSFTEIMDAFREVKIAREAQFHLFKMVVKHMNVGIMAIDDSGEIILMNDPAYKILSIPELKYWRLVQKHVPAFTTYIDSLDTESGELLDLHVAGQNKNLSIRKNIIKIDQSEHMLISFQDIRSEIELKEIQAWHKLIRILTHEIMNSMTPMISMTDTMLMLVETETGVQRSTKEIGDETIEDMRYSIRTIQERSRGLLHFLDDYRKLTKIPRANLERQALPQLIRSIEQLMKSELGNRNIQLTIGEMPPQVQLMIDSNLIQQVLINLLTNAIHAVEEVADPKIQMVFEDYEEYFTVKIVDNGHGIDEDKIDQVFVPFFSTKQEGSGIGLSLCRNIMYMHKGTISFDASHGNGAAFTLTFPKATNHMIE